MFKIFAFKRMFIIILLLLPEAYVILLEPKRNNVSINIRDNMTSVVVLLITVYGYRIGESIWAWIVDSMKGSRFWSSDC